MSTRSTGLRARSAILLLLVGGLYACSRPEPQAHVEAPRPVRTLLVESSGSGADWTLPGEIRPRIEVRYGFRVGGRVLERKVEIGDRVATGQLLARLDPKDLTPLLDAQLAQEAAARTELTLAQAELARTERLRAGNFISDANVDRQRAAVKAAAAKVEAAGAQVNQARNSLGFQALKADTAGTVIGIDAEAGQVVAVGQTVVRVAQHGDAEVAVAVPEQDLQKARQITDWEVELTGLPGRRWKAKLRELSPAADPASRTYAARLTLVGDTREVAYGMSATAHAQLAGRSTLRVPHSALFSQDGPPRVWVVDAASGTVRGRVVETGQVFDDSVEIVKGLSGSERIVTAGANLLREGQAVKMTEDAPRVAGAPK